MIFYISNDHTRSLAATGTLHVTPRCSTLSQSNRKAWEATPSEVASAHTLSAVCTPQATGQEATSAGGPATRP